MLLVMMNGGWFHLRATAWISTQAPSSFRRYHASESLLKLRSFWSDDAKDDDDWGSGRIVRKKRPESRPSYGTDGQSTQNRPWRRDNGSDQRANDDERRPRRPSQDNPRNDWRRDRDQGGRTNNYRDRFDRNAPNDRNNRRRVESSPDDSAPKIDMKGLEAEGFVHLYGLAPILSALRANRRDFAPRKSLDDIASSRLQRSEETDYDADNDASEKDGSKAKNTKPEAQYTPWLFLQDRSSGGDSGRTGDKLAAAAKVKQLAEGLGIPVAFTDKGSLNALSGNRPHQVRIQRAALQPLSPRFACRNTISRDLTIVLFLSGLCVALWTPRVRINIKDSVSRWL
jgi:hypothetical protein